MGLGGGFGGGGVQDRAVEVKACCRRVREESR